MANLRKFYGEADEPDINDVGPQQFGSYVQGSGLQGGENFTPETGSPWGPVPPGQAINISASHGQQPEQDPKLLELMKLLGQG